MHYRNRCATALVGILLPLFYMVSFSCFGQEVRMKQDPRYQDINGSPTVAKLNGLIQESAEHYVGRVSLDFPLFEIRDGKIGTSITLRYVGGNGIKVQDVAGIAGTGWQLEIGDAVVRNLRGLSDEHSGDQGFGYSSVKNASTGAPDTQLADGLNLFNFYSYSQITGNSELRSQANWSLGAASGNFDAIPDIFNSVLTGKMVVGADRSTGFMDVRGIRTGTPGIHSQDSSWTFVTVNGTRYRYGSTADSRSHSAFEFFNTRTWEGYFWKPFISAWMLDEISIPGHRSKISFSYERGASYSYLNYKRTQLLVGYNVVSPWLVPPKDNSEIREPNPLYCTQIRTSYGSRYVLSYRDRLDLPGAKHIYDITEFDSQGVLVKRIVFNMGYFENPQVTGEQRYRLKLIGIDQYDGNNSRQVLASFAYDEIVSLPARSSVKFDHWGYPNNNPSSSSFVSQGAVKTPDTIRGQAGILKQVT